MQPSSLIKAGSISNMSSLQVNYERICIAEKTEYWIDKSLEMIFLSSISSGLGIEGTSKQSKISVMNYLTSIGLGPIEFYIWSNEI